MKILATFFCITLATGCATARDSTFLGAGVGGTVGAGVGTAIGKNYGSPSKGAAIGAAAGAALGGLAGWMEYRKMGNSRNQSPFHTPGSGDAPSLTMPDVRRVWVPSKIEDNKYVNGHWIFIIDRNSSWRLDDPPMMEKKKNGR